LQPRQLIAPEATPKAEQHECFIAAMPQLVALVAGSMRGMDASLMMR
jgi:hypothetical protein